MLSQPFFIPGILFLVVSLPLILGLLSPNRFYGVRTVETLADKQLWYRVNRFCGWALLVSSLLYLCVAVFFPSAVTGETLLGRWVVHLGAFLGPLLLSLLLLRNYLKQPE